MKTTPRILALAGLSVALGACAAPTPSEASVEPDITAAEMAAKPTAKLGPVISTIKPGASVTFTHETSGPVIVDGSGYVVFTVNEGYPTGTLDLVASSNEGLEVFGPSATQTVNMADGTTHTWRVDFTGLTDGVHYLRVRATAKPSSETGMFRGYSARIEVGDWKSAAAVTEAAKPMQEQSDGAMAVILEADETIE